MLYYPVAFGVIVHVFFWGAGAALLLMPRPWQGYWPILAPVAGCAVQSLAVWAGAYADLSGTDVYAWASELLPLALLGAGVWSRRAAVAGDLRRLWSLWLLCAAVLAVLIRPLAAAAKGLTTASLGSCDAADYAAGARVFKEFAHHDRSGFLGLTEVVRVLSVDNFYDFWLRLNHFTPSALIALNGTIFHCAPHELTGLMAPVVLVASLPVVFWMARSLFGYGPSVSLFLTALYGFGPVTWYAVYQVALGQLLAAPAIALITWAGVALWHSYDQRGPRGRYFGMLAMAYVLILGSYNFIIVVSLVPAIAYAAGLAIWEDRSRLFLRWLIDMVAPLAAAGVVMWARVAGLEERFRQFANYDFGWRIPALTPEGWFGLVGATGLEPWPEPLRLLAGGLVVGLLAVALWRSARRGRRVVFLILCLLVPPLVGYGLLTWRGARLQTNASYDAYKLFAVFYPGILAAAGYWMTLAYRRWLTWTFALVAATSLGLVVGNGAIALAFQRAMSTPPLIVGRDLIQLGRIEAMTAVDSLNMRLGYPAMWERLWANALLLRKPQYFFTHTYEGRINTLLRGQWDLDGGLVTTLLPQGDSVRLNPRYALVRVASPWYFRAGLGTGWYAQERLPRSDTSWQWTAERASILVVNTHAGPMAVTPAFDVSSREDRPLELWLGDHLIGRVPVTPQRGLRQLPEFMLPPGESQLEVRSAVPPSIVPGDDRPLGFCVYGIELTAGAQRKPL